MNPLNSGHMSRQISPHPAPSAYQAQPIRPSSQGYPSYPIRIPSGKLSKAIKLYRRYLLEEGLAQRVQEPPALVGFEIGTHLSIPGARVPSGTSHTSSHQTALSVSTSAYDGVTDRSSVISFNESESALSSMANPGAELVSFKGKKVKQRTRNRLSGPARAKAALIRHLGSCSVCRTRNVACPLEHHDIASLEEALQARAQSHQSQSQSHEHQSHSSISSSSNHNYGSAPTSQPVSGGAQGLTDSLLGFGQNPQLLQQWNTVEADDLDLQSPNTYGDPLVDIPSPTPLFYDSTGPPDLSAVDLDLHPYSVYENGDMFALGVHRRHFLCQHLDGKCQQFFDNPEELQNHFEIAHFAFIRLEPAHRYVCSVCQYLNDHPSGTCHHCGVSRSIELWIYGSFIRTSSNQRHAPDGAQSFRHVLTSMPHWRTSSAGLSLDLRLGQLDPDTNSNTNLGSGTIPGRHNFQDDSTHQSPDAPYYQYGANNSRQHSGSQFPLIAYSGGPLPLTGASPFNFQYPFSKWVPKYRVCKIVLLILVLFAASVVVVETRDWIAMKVRVALPHFQTNLPTIGFCAALASFATHWSVYGHREHTTKRAPEVRNTNGTKVSSDKYNGQSQKQPRCPLHALPPLPFQCSQTAAGTSVGGL